MAISVKNVTKRFGDFVALDDVSIDVPDGGLTALLGPSGSGKSTLLRVIAGLEQPDDGRSLISGEDATEHPPQDRSVGFVFQHYAAFKHMTVFDNVAFGLKIRKRPKAGDPASGSTSCSTWSTSRLRQAFPDPALRRPASADGPGQGAGGRAARCCCWTSRSGPSTRRSARSCAPGCAASTTTCT